MRASVLASIGAIEALLPIHIVTQILVSRLPVRSARQVIIVDINALTGSLCAAVERGNGVSTHSSIALAPGEVADFEWTSVASSFHSIVACALGDPPCPLHVVHLESAESDVLCPAEATAAAVGWKAGVDAGPGLDPGTPDGIVEDDVLCGDVLDDFDLSGVLADATHGERQTVVEGAIGDVDVGGVLFHADRVVAVVDNPAEKRDVISVHSLFRQSVTATT